MNSVETVLDWMPSAGSEIAGRVSDVVDMVDFDMDDVAEGLADLAEIAEAGAMAVVAVGETSARLFVRLARRHPLIAALVAGTLIAGIVALIAKRRRSADESTQTTPRAA